MDRSNVIDISNEYTGQKLANLIGIKAETDKVWMCRCPCHDDKSPSLSISKEKGKILFYCHAGCTQDSLIAYFKSQGWYNNISSNLVVDTDWQTFANVELPRYCLTVADLDKAGVSIGSIYFRGNARQKLNSLCYPYLNANGEIKNKYKSLKRENGHRLTSGDRGYWGVFPAYASKPTAGNETLYITAGEEKTLLLNQIGLRSLSTHAGEKSISTELAQFVVNGLGNKTVVIILDNDPTGKAATANWHKTLTTAGADCKVVYLPEYQNGNDVCDYGYNVGLEQLREVLTTKQQLPFVMDSKHKINIVDLLDLENESDKANYIFDDILSFSGNILIGDTGCGKSPFALQMTLCALYGLPFLGTPCECRIDKVFWLCNDMATKTFASYLKRMILALGITDSYAQVTQKIVYTRGDGFDATTEAGLEAITAALGYPTADTKVMVVLDLLLPCLDIARFEGNENRQMSKALQAQKTWCNNHPNYCLVAITHTNKQPSGQLARISTSRVNGATGIIARFDNRIVLGIENEKNGTEHLRVCFNGADVSDRKIELRRLNQQINDTYQILKKEE